MGAEGGEKGHEYGRRKSSGGPEEHQKVAVTGFERGREGAKGRNQISPERRKKGKQVKKRILSSLFARTLLRAWSSLLYM
jgi:hypothetical protein